jgi:hypothetical protein
MDKKELGALHEALATLLLERIHSGEATSGDMSVARQFLKDNAIDANINQSDPLLHLVKALPFDPEAEIRDTA